MDSLRPCIPPYLLKFTFCERCRPEIPDKNYDGHCPVSEGCTHMGVKRCIRMLILFFLINSLSNFICYYKCVITKLELLWKIIVLHPPSLFCIPSYKNPFERQERVAIGFSSPTLMYFRTTGHIRHPHTLGYIMLFLPECIQNGRTWNIWEISIFILVPICLFNLILILFFC